MGVDARMFARLRGENRIKPEDALPLAVEMCKTIGAGNFLITKATEFDFGRPHHALSIIEPLSREDAAEYESPELVGKVVWFQDGDPVVAEPDEQFVEVHLFTRFYGPEYARGDWTVIRTVAEWIEFKLPTAEVWYGGDSSGICARRFGAAERALVNRFFLGTGHRTYRDVFQGISSRGATPPKCQCCEIGMSDTGGGGVGAAQRTFWYCDGCDGKVVTFGDGREPVRLTRHEDFFDFEEKRAESATRRAAQMAAEAAAASRGA